MECGGKRSATPLGRRDIYYLSAQKEGPGWFGACGIRALHLNLFDRHLVKKL